MTLIMDRIILTTRIITRLIMAIVTGATAGAIAEAATEVTAEAGGAVRVQAAVARTRLLV